MPIWKFKRKSKLFSIPISSRITALIEVDTAYHILNDLVRDTAYRTFSVFQHQISHRVLGIVVRESGYSILGSMEIGSAWHILYELLQREIAWKNLNSIQRTLLWYFMQEGLTDIWPVGLLHARQVQFAITATSVALEHTALDHVFVVLADEVEELINKANSIRFEYVALSQ